MNTSKYLYVNSRDEFFRVDISKIVYFESDGNYTAMVLSNKIKATLSMNLGQMQEVLTQSLKEKASMFARVGRRHIVNLNYVCHIQILRQYLTLSDGQNFDYRLDVSKDALRRLRQMYIDGINKLS